MDQAAAAGLDFFNKLNKAGNFVPIDVTAAALAQGTAPIAVRWDYLALGDRDTLKGIPPVTVVVPKTGIVAGVYVQAISAYAPHPNAAKLWMEWLYSDASQIIWLKGYCHPIRFQDLVQSQARCRQTFLPNCRRRMLTRRRCFRPSLSRAQQRRQLPSSGIWSSA